MTARRYPSPEAFKQALEQRLRATTKTGAAFARKRQLLVFDRFLARIVRVLGDTATLKGGLVLELRLDRARTTKDIDLRLTGPSDGVLTRLQEVARLDLGDFFTFEIGPDADHPEIQGEAMIYDGLRFRAAGRMAGKPYGQPFGVDVGFGDPMLGAPEVVTAEDVLGFAGIAPPTLRIYPIETHIAEKLHAYTLPRKRPNSRVKDLPDLALLASAQPLDAKRVRSALEQTFGFRKTHQLPVTLPEPPATWAAPYAAMVLEDQLRWPTLADVTVAARAFLDPIHGFTDAEIARLFPETGHRFAKTNSRPVTGSMTNHVESTRWYIQHDGGIKVADVRALNRRLNATPMGALAPGSHMDFPIDVLTRIIRPSGAG